jgi:hypothetical protein
MRSLAIISRHFIPNIFDILGLFTGGKQVFKLDVWAVDEFHLESMYKFVLFRVGVHPSGQLSNQRVH